MDPAILALIAAAIGASGAICGQLVAQILTGRRERRRAADERADQRQSRFLDEKRAVFVAYLRAVHNYDQFFRSRFTTTPKDPKADAVRFQKDWEEIGRIEVELRLIAPELKAVFGRHLGTRIALALASEQKLDRDTFNRHTSGYSAWIRDLEAEMRSSLGIEWDENAVHGSFLFNSGSYQRREIGGAAS